jgi:hypothetical protein
MNQTNNNENKMTAGKTAIEELAEIVLDDDREELRNDYWAFFEQNEPIRDRLVELSEAGQYDSEYYQLKKQAAWNDYAMACIEAKIGRFGVMGI